MFRNQKKRLKEKWVNRHEIDSRSITLDSLPKGFLVSRGAGSIRRAPSQQTEMVLFIAASLFWLWSGLSTWHDLIGHPRDAPFLRIPGHIRSVCFWWIPAAYALLCAKFHINPTRAFFLLSVGPTVRFVSYFVSWASTWPWLDNGVPHSFLWGYAPKFIYGHGIPDSVLKGDPKAWGSMWIYGAILVGLGGFTYVIRLLKDEEEKVNRLQVELANSKLEGARRESAESR